MQKAEFGALSPAPSIEELSIFCIQHSVAHGTAVIRELSLVLDVLLQVLRCGCCLSGEQLFRLLEMGVSMGFVGPESALQLLGNCNHSDVVGQLSFRWIALVSSIFDCRLALSSPSEHVLFKALSQGESIQQKRDDFMSKFITPLIRMVDQTTVQLFSTSVTGLYQNLTVCCSEYLLFLVSMLLQTTITRARMHSMSDFVLNDYTEWASETYDVIYHYCRRSESISFLADICMAHIRQPNSISNVFEIDKSESSVLDQVHSVQSDSFEDTTKASIEIFDSSASMMTFLQCNVLQEVLDFFLLDLFREVDSGGVLEIDVPVLSLISQLYNNDRNLCRPFWEQWAIYRAAGAGDEASIDYEPFSPLCRLIMELLHTLEAPNYFVQVISSLLCDEASCYECFGFLAQPVVLRSWEKISNLGSVKQIDGEEYTKECLVEYRKSRVAVDSFSDIVGQPFDGAVGKIIAVDDSYKCGKTNSWCLVRWEDNCYSSWWGVCFKILSCTNSAEHFLAADEIWNAKSVVKNFIAKILRFEGKSAIIDHFESHWNDLCMLHSLNNIGITRGANEYLAHLRHNSITPSALKLEPISDVAASEIIYQCSGIPINDAKNLVVMLRAQYQTFSDLLVNWCFHLWPDDCGTASYASCDHLYSSLNLVRNLLSNKNANLIYASVLRKFSGMHGAGGFKPGHPVEKLVLPDFIASICEKSVSVETLNIRYHAIRAFDALVPFMLAPESCDFFSSLFSKLDRNCDGKISETDFRDVLPDILPTKEFPAAVLSKFYFHESSHLDCNNFVASCILVKSGFDASKGAVSYTESDKLFSEFITQNFQRYADTGLPGQVIVMTLTSIAQFCIRTLLVCDLHKKRNPDGIVIIDKFHEALSHLQLRSLRTILNIVSCDRGMSRTATTLRDWFANSFISDSSFQGAVLRISLDIGVNSVLLRGSYMKKSYCGHKVLKLSNFKSIKELTYDFDPIMESVRPESAAQKNEQDNLLPLDFSYFFPQRSCYLSLPKMSFADAIVLESLSQMALQLLCDLLDIIDTGEAVPGLPAIMNAFNTARAYQPVSGNKTHEGSSYIRPDGLITFISSTSRYHDASNRPNVSYSGILCGMIGYSSFVKKRCNYFCNSKVAKLRVPGLAARLLLKLLRAESTMRSTHVGISYSNRIFDCIGPQNTAAFTTSISAVLELSISASSNLGLTEIDELIALKTEIMDTLLFLAQNDHMSLGYLLLVVGEVSSDSMMPPRSGRVSTSTRSSQTRSLLSSATISLLSQLDSIASFRKGCTPSELKLLDKTLYYLRASWETCRPGSSAVLASHVISIVESNIFWSVVTSPLMRDLDTFPPFSEQISACNMKSVLLNPDISCYCYKLSILASSFSFLSMERFGQLFSIEETAVKLRNFISTNENDESKEKIPSYSESYRYHVSNFCRGKVDDFFRRCAECQRFLYWTKTYPSLVVEMKLEGQAQNSALEVGANLIRFKNTSLIGKTAGLSNAGSDYIYSVMAVVNAAVCHGWNPKTVSDTRNNAWSRFILSVCNANCMWSIADFRHKLLKKFRCFLEITVFPPESDSSAGSRSLSISSRRSPSFELNGSPRGDLSGGSPTSNQSKSPKSSRHRLPNSMLSPKGGSYSALPPSPSVLRGDSSFIGGGVLLHIYTIKIVVFLLLCSLRFFRLSSLDKRSYHLLVELLRQTARGDEMPSVDIIENDEQPEYYFAGNNQVSGMNEDILGSRTGSIDELGILLIAEKIAIATTMLHHQLKDVCVRTIDPSLARTKFRDANISRLTTAKMVELLELVCSAYKRVYSSLSGILFDKSVNSIGFFWGRVWSVISVDLLTCMQLLILGLHRSSGDDDSCKDVSERSNQAKHTAFWLVLNTLMKDISGHPDFKTLLLDSNSSEITNLRHPLSIGCNTSQSSSNSEYAKGFSDEWLRPSSLISIEESSDFADSFEESFVMKRVGFVKISLQILYSALSAIRLWHSDSVDNPIYQWHIDMKKSSAQIDFMFTMFSELCALSVPYAERECDYSCWGDYSDPRRTVSHEEIRDSSLRAASNTRKKYQLINETKGYWGCLNAVLDTLLKFVETSVLRPQDSLLWKILSLLNSSALFRKFQQSLTLQKRQKKISLLMTYSACSGEDSALCSAWERCVRFVAAVAVSQGSGKCSISSGKCENGRSNPLSVSQLLCIFVDTYKELLLLPFVSSGSRVSIGQVRLLKTTAALFDTFEHALPVWKCISNLRLLVRQRVAISISFVSSVLGDGSRLTATTENIKNVFVLFSDSRNIGDDKPSSHAPDSRPASPRDGDRLGRTQSFDSFSETFISPQSKKYDLGSVSDKTYIAVGVLLEVMVPLFSFLRHSLPSPFFGDVENKMETKKCFGGGSIVVPSWLTAGTSVVYRTKREKFVSQNGEQGAEGQTGKRSVAQYSVVEDELEIGIILEVDHVLDVLVDDSKSNYDGHGRRSIVYTMLLLDGTIEDGVLSESVVSACAPVIPFLPRQEIHRLSPVKTRCTSAHLVQVFTV